LILKYYFEFVSVKLDIIFSLSKWALNDP